MPLKTARRRELTLLVVLQLIHLIVISAQVPVRGGSTVLETIIFRAIAPFQRGTATAVGGVVDFFKNYVALRHAQDDNRRLRSELDSTRLELNRLQGERGEVGRLQKLLSLSQNLPYASVAARVTGADSLNPMRTLLIDRGTRTGVRHNCPVISPEGFLVGRVIPPVAPSEATVQLLTDVDASVGTILTATRTYGILSGSGDGRCAVRFVPNSVEVATGEEVRTSGLDQIYPRGVLVGRVASSAPGRSVFRDIVVEPAVKLREMEYVLVLTGDKSGGPGASEIPPRDIP